MTCWPQLERWGVAKWPTLRLSISHLRGRVGVGGKTGRGASPSRPLLRRELVLHLLQQAGCLAAADAGDVVLIFQQHAQRVVDCLGIEGDLVELDQRLGPV